jgi:hypothetical protein
MAQLFSMTTLQLSQQATLPSWNPISANSPECGT